ncbi:MAG: AAA family ATPase [archaeon]|nr:AAA family ATPase [archaeon]
MVDIQKLREEVKEFATKAVAEDKLEHYEEASQLYIKAASRLNMLLKYDDNPYNKETYKKKGCEYCERAKKLKEALDGGKKKGGDGKDGKDGGAQNEEDKALEDQLSGCLVKEKPNVKWSDVAGLEKAKDALKEAVVLPIKFPQLFQGKRKPWKGILLYGPPGTGKSFLAKAAATEAGGQFYIVSAANIVSKWMGESERLVRSLFDLARKNRPAVIFMDEIDSCLSARTDGENDATRRLKTEFLVQMQGVGKDDDGILVLGATNVPWSLDPAVRRRFQKKIYISLPEEDARLTMFKIHLGNTPNTLTEKELEILAELTDGYSGSDIATLTRDAVYEPLRKCEMANYFKKVDDGKGDYYYYPCEAGEPGAIQTKLQDLPEPEKLNPPKVTFEDYLIAIQKIKATVTEADLKKNDDFTAEFGQEG